MQSTSSAVLKRTFAAALLSLAALTPALAQNAGPAAGSDNRTAGAPAPDPRVGLRAGLHDAAEAAWNMRVLSRTRPPEKFAGATNSDLAFSGKYAFQGNYNGFMVWDVSNPASPTLAKEYFCPASQSDVSVYKNLLFVSGEAGSGRLDCGGQGVQEAVSRDRLRGIRIFDIRDINNPRYIGNVQTCRGSHTHTVLEDPRDRQNVYVYVSGSANVRSPEELPGCVSDAPEQNPNSALFRIEVIRVPLANPERAAIVSSPRIFQGLTAPPRHGETPEDAAEIARQVAAAKARGAFTARVQGTERVLAPRLTTTLLDSIMRARGGTGTPTGADTAALRAGVQQIINTMFPEQTGPRPGPTQCHDITVYPAMGLAGGACEGYGLLLDIRDPANPVRLTAAADSNFSYWHSATFNNDATKVLFSDEWGGGGQAKCRASDPRAWGANAIFTINNRRDLQFQSYYKLPAPQTAQENCVAHNGSLIPIPGRDVMVQSWYQGGVSVFDWTDARRPVEIAFFDRGPVDSTRMGNGGTWSAYWYNGVIVSSEISRGLDIMELTPSALLSQNEIDAAKTVRQEYLNPQGQPKMVWPASFALARAYADQLERSRGLTAARLGTVRQALTRAERATGAARRTALTTLAGQINGYAAGSSDAAKVRMLSGAVRDLATGRQGQ
ncbi:MAG TPA: hypothetical protein VK420_05730 [Longimicrobium sp.]|nr:hypothetical protein [Longimicrobium sp.]